MRYLHHPLLRKCLTGLGALLLGGAALAQLPIRSDVGPPPAEERNSVGAVVLMESPVLAQRELATQARLARADTRMLGRETLRVTQRALTRDALDADRAMEAARFRQEGAGSLVAR